MLVVSVKVQTKGQMLIEGKPVGLVEEKKKSSAINWL